MTYKESKEDTDFFNSTVADVEHLSSDEILAAGERERELTRQRKWSEERRAKRPWWSKVGEK